MTRWLDAEGNVLRQHKRKGSEPQPITNIRMEMTAACVALESLEVSKPEQITVFCDANLIPTP